MFNTLASYFLGSTTISDTGNNKNDENLTDTEKQQKIIAVACSDDEIDDWWFVEEDSHQTDSEEELSFVEIKNIPPHVRGRHSRNNSGAGSRDGLLSLSPTSILPNSMEESWFVTPPPCFTSTGPVNMPTSPLENLLIEHPSMSVYHSIRTILRDVGDDEIAAVLGVEFEESNQSATNHYTPTPTTPPINTAIIVSRAALAPIFRRIVTDRTKICRKCGIEVCQRPQCRVSCERPETLEHKDKLRFNKSQKSYDRKSRENICRNALDRRNNVREVNSKGGRQKRNDMNHSKVLSRANNNRKC